MPSQGPNLPSSVSSDGTSPGAGDEAWTNTGNATTDNGSYAEVTGRDDDPTSTFLAASGFGFSLPIGAVVDGIEVTAKRHSTNGDMYTGTVEVRGAYAGTSSSQGDSSVFPTSDDYKTWGGPSNNWGVANYTDQDLNDSGFTAAIIASYGGASPGSDTAYIDVVKVTVYYTNPDLSIDVGEDIALTESSSTALSGIIHSISVFDAITVTESKTVDVVCLINLSESITVTENRIELVLAFINKSESITVTESATVLVVDLINRNDSITVTESVTVAPLVVAPNVFDTVTITESFTPKIPLYFINLTQAVTVVENISTNLLCFISKVQGIHLLDVPHLNVIDFISKSDAVTVTESRTVNNKTDPVKPPNEQVHLTDVLSVSLGGGKASVSDSVTVSESFSVALTLKIAVSDAITHTESLTAVSSGPVRAVNDGVTVSESLILQMTRRAAPSDSLTVSESVTCRLTPPATTSDNITVTESSTVRVVCKINVHDDIIHTEFSQVGYFKRQLIDSVTVTENFQVIVLSAPPPTPIPVPGEHNLDFSPDEAVFQGDDQWDFSGDEKIFAKEQ